MKLLISVLAGAALGWLHFLWFEKVVKSMVDERKSSRSRLLLALSGMGRYLFTFFAGISLIQIATLDAISFGAGLILAMAIFRVWQIQKILRLEESQKDL